ncbi:flagellin [Neorhizobium sp. JUb45]|uniref:flagellin N-terminal helical domain-containing protein n=2 Tax=unclassified Neorhizobium TaxID=2629175 RepID=UPI00104A4C6C|nr:flagellin [Neorhizobium sp. JUb45]TCR01158.1 flagellin [Neorhizobium sp. JUb45]
MSSILTNNGAISALQTLRSIESQMGNTRSEVASGMRIDVAADNAAYWSIATTMRSDNKAISAVGDALNLGAAKLDVAYTGIESVIDVLSDFQTKLVAAKEPGVDPGKIQKELDQLKQQVIDISTSASFSGENWLNTEIADINDSDLNRVSMVSSFTRTGSAVSLGKTDFHLSEVSLFNSEGGGLLQADKRRLKTLGGVRLFDTYMDNDGLVHMSQTNLTGGTNARSGFTFAGPLTFDTNDKIEFDVIVDADNPADLPGPHDPGKLTHITIDRTMVDSVLSISDGKVSTYTQFVQVLSNALSLSGSGASAGLVPQYPSGTVPNQIAMQTNESSGLDGSALEIRNFSSDVGSAGMSNFLAYGTRGSAISLGFTPFEVYTDGDDPDGVSVTFRFTLNGASSQTYEFDRPYVNSLLGKDTGKVETADEMVTLLKSFMEDGWPNVIIEATDPSTISVRSDTAGDRLSGIKTSIGFTGMSVSIEPIPTQNFVDIDIVENPEMLDRYIGYINVVTSDIIDAGTSLGALKTTLDMQTSLMLDLSDVIEKGVGRLVDADMDETSTRLKALQTQEQLAIQALSIANSSSSSMLSLFQS